MLALFWCSRFKVISAFFSISRGQDEGRGGCFSNRVCCCLEFHDLWMMALVSKISFAAGLRIALADICVDLGRATWKALLCRKCWNWIFASRWQVVKRAVWVCCCCCACSIRVKSVPRTHLCYGYLFVLRQKEPPEKLFCQHNSVCTHFLLTKFYIRAKQCL